MFRRHHPNTLYLGTAILLAGTIVCDPVHGATASARQQVRTGLKQHQAGDYSAAAESFAAAQKILPEEPRVTYDRACALAAEGKREEATDLFQQAALAREPELVAASHYNLGCLVAQQARELFGENPEDAEVATREQGVKLLHQAVTHYRDCLRVDNDHAAARKNLETLRLWIKHMEDVWAQRDREKRRDDLDLLQFLEWIDGEQRMLEAATKALGHIDGSPRQRQAIAQTENAQRLLADEIEPLQQKLEAALAGDQPADATTAQAVQALKQMAQQAKSAMFRAADDLVGRELPAALVAQGEAIDSLNEVYRAVAPYEHVIQKAIKTEQSLVDTAVAIVDEETDESLVDRELLARDQGYIAGWSETLPARAQQGLAQLQEGNVTQTEIGPPTDDQQKKQQQTQAAMKESYEKAIELAPKIVELANDASSDLKEGKWQDARPKQEEALTLLKEIAPKTPPEEDKQDQENEDKQDQQADQKDQPQDGENDQQQEQQDQQQQEKSGEQKQQDLSRQQAEALLSKARQREREYRERQKEQLQALQGTFQVDRDW
ncbi:MAG: hypothetical protein H6823_16730 [Planctomycetaceae bacterium]|nr:hypothetical protein [Planctomycetales bacterium]MCB9939886.1 hypothetical protein [Planctomycetaceae bacterium]